ncbi:MAG: crotonase/enoyl-CoA hydratase family protein [Deltaproteobacteria bacterium]|nr:crotonase/enoyl-CoA hydratase family protein [Deltaproteobacteria bacterium]MBI3386495.1 crotonase/enoyl-CoA hydratase family protein [Deltaproteobacteria bacterium]
MSDLLVERDHAAMILTMNRPKRMNALSPDMMGRMFEAWQQGSADPAVRCFILTGAGGNFCSGMDLRAMSGDVDEEPSEYVQRVRQDPTVFLKALLRDYRPTKPIIAAVEGVAIAGGTEILQGTDIRVAGSSARFGVSEVRWGLYPGAGSAVRLRRQIPYTVAAEILLTGKHITAAEAKEYGLIGHVVAEGEALAKAKEIAATIAENGPLAVEAILKTLHKTDGMSEAEALVFDFEVGMPIFRTEDAKEGPLAFTQKRKPNFKRR